MNVFCDLFSVQAITYIFVILVEPIQLAAILLGLRVRISPSALMFVSCMCCILCQVDPSATGRSLVFRLVLPRVTVSLCVVKCSNNALYLQWLGRKKERKKDVLIIIFCSQDFYTICYKSFDCSL
jgi:hypothetical protein